VINQNYNLFARIVFARHALQCISYEALKDVVSLFTDLQLRVLVAVTTSPAGSSTAASPRLTIFDLLLAQGVISESR